MDLLLFYFLIIYYVFKEYHRYLCILFTLFLFLDEEFIEFLGFLNIKQIILQYQQLNIYLIIFF